MYSDEFRNKNEDINRCIDNIFQSGIRKIYKLRTNVENGNYTFSYTLTADEFDAIFTRLNTAMVAGKLDDSLRITYFGRSCIMLCMPVRWQVK